MPDSTGNAVPCDPSIYNIMPPQPKDLKAGQLPEEKIREFFDQGFVIVENYFTKEELDTVCTDIDKLVDDIANKLYDAGKIKNLHKNLGFYKRLTEIEKEFPGSNILLHKHDNLPQSFRNLWANERLLNLVEQLIGPDIAGHPVWNLRCKTPRSFATVVPWHQDAAYLDNDSYTTLTPTAWIPLIDANAENGCLQFARYGHITGKVAAHSCCAGPTWYVMLDEADMVRDLGVDLEKDVVVVPLNYGSFVLFNNMIPHQSLPNNSENVRWSLDLRWQNSSRPYGFFGVKNGVVMRTPDDPKPNINWDPFCARNRHKDQSVNKNEDDFDTTVSGPWMLKWPLVHHNRHTDTLVENEMTWHKN